MSHSKEEIEKIKKLEEFLNLYEDSYINNLITERRLKQSIYLKDNFDERYENFKNSKNKKNPSSYSTDKSKYKLLICPNCEMSGKGLRFFKFHFENCDFKNHDLKLINELLIQTQNPYSIVSKFKLPVNKVYNYLKFHNLLKKSSDNIRECPHCKLKLISGSIRFHYSNCKLKGINLDLFKTELTNQSVIFVSKKYGLSRTFVNTYIDFFDITKSDSIEEEHILNNHICPKCEQRTNNSNKRFHYDNCKFKNLDIQIIKSELSSLSNYQLSKKYKVSKKSFHTFRKFHVSFNL